MSQESSSLLDSVPHYINSVSDYTSTIFSSEFSRANGALSRDVTSILNGHCFYHKNMLCELHDYQLIYALLAELEQYENEQAKKNDKNKGIINWNHHFKYEDPTFSPTFHLITQLLGEYFNLNVLATRLNIYTPSDWKTFHHDSHKYSQGQKEDMTVGVSLGSQRSLSFLHPVTGSTFEFPQSNGDVFAFDSDVNGTFMHGVPKLPASALDNRDNGPRLSIICWGKRKTFNERNCGKDWQEREEERLMMELDTRNMENFSPENDQDEYNFQLNNNKYSHYVPAPTTYHGAGGRPSSEPIVVPSEIAAATTTKSDQTQTNLNNDDTVPGIPLSEVKTLMAKWIDYQIEKKNSGSQLKAVLYNMKYTPLLNICLENFTKHNTHNLSSNATLKNSKELTTNALKQHVKIKKDHYKANKNNGDNDDADDDDSMTVRSVPMLYSTNQVLTGPRGLKIRVGATNKRFELKNDSSTEVLSHQSMRGGYILAKPIVTEQLSTNQGSIVQSGVTESSYNRKKQTGNKNNENNINKKPFSKHNDKENTQHGPDNIHDKVTNGSNVNKTKGNKIKNQNKPE